MSWVAGLDGVPHGWMAVLRNTVSGETRGLVLSRWTEILKVAERPEVIAIDIPIGLLDEAQRGGRQCDQVARNLLGRVRASAVFSPPVFGALSATTYPGAVLRNRQSSACQLGISQQCYGLFDKLREIHSSITPEIQERVFEIHPELSFLEIAGHPTAMGKKTPAGIEERKKCLHGFAGLIEKFRKNRIPGAATDDLLDACAACWTAERIGKGIAVRIPGQPPVDTRGLRMEMLR